jgi:hypothetical protein
MNRYYKKARNILNFNCLFGSGNGIYNFREMDLFNIIYKCIASIKVFVLLLLHNST